jgi:DNA polymerase-1
MEKFLVIDGNSIMNRAFYGISNIKMKSSSEGIATNAIYGFLNIYWMILDKITPDYIAVSFDLHAPTFRHLMYEDYKGTRKGMPDELREQMPIIKEVLTAMNVPIIELEGYEADDILGTVANKNTKNNIFTYILTGDKDSFQLISNNTSIIIPTTKMGKTTYSIYTPELLRENQNIDPSQVIHIKGLMGDASDNIPGVKGVGEKTAYNLIGKYTTIENIYDNIDNLEASEKIKEKLINDKEIAFLSKELATINIDVPFDMDYEHCKFSDVNKSKLYELFKKLEFNKFLLKYDFSSVIDNDNISTEELKKENKELNLLSNIDEIKIIDASNIDKCIDEILNIFENEKKISYLLNGINVPGYINKLNIDEKIFAFYIESKNTIYILNIDSILKVNENVTTNINTNSDIITKIFEKFITCNCAKLGYNIKQDLLYFLNNTPSNIHNNLNEFIFDIMIAYYLMDSNRTNYTIEYILKNIYDIEFNYKEEENLQITFFEDFEEKKDEENKEFLTKFNINNITLYLKAIYFSHNKILKELEELNMLNLFNEIEMPLTETLASMEHFGMYIDLEKLNKFDILISDSIINLEKNIYEIAGEEFNINSTQQLGNILFNKLNLPTFKKNKTGFSTDKAVLEKLMDKHEIIGNILEYRQIMKLKTTYVDSLRNKIASDGRIHTTFMQTVASTGRLSSVEPNLQNIPVRLELGKKIRSFFIGENNNYIMDADYSQIELRVLAHMSKDETMIEAFKNNIDIHKVTASQVFEVPIEEVDSKMRSHAKAVNFGIVYGISEFGLAKNIESSREEAKKYIENYLNKYHGIREFMKKTIEEAKEEGYVSTMFGRRRYIPELKEKNKNTIQFGERIAMNTPIQGTAADIIKLAMNKIYKTLKKNNLKSKLIMQVHDELIIETIPEEEKIVEKIMYDCMENVISLNIPLNIDLNIAKSWYDAK